MLFATPPRVSAVLVTALAIALPVMLTCGIVFGRGYFRAFSIGGVLPALFPCLSMLVWQSWQLASHQGPDPLDERVACAAFLLFDIFAVVVNGVSAAGLYWLLCHVFGGADGAPDASNCDALMGYSDESCHAGAASGRNPTSGSM
jgi:hypothetical protein